NSKLITLSGKAPGFYDRKDVDVDASVREMELDGLDVEASELLLAEVGKIVDEGKWAELAKSVGGHPLALELADDETGTGRFQDYIYEQIISKDMDSFDFLSLCSVLRGGFNPWNMKLFGFGKAQGLSANAYFVKYDDGGVRLHQAVGQAILERAGERGMKMAHERAADYCREFDEEPTEVLYHLIEAGLVERGCEHAASIRNYLVSNSNLAMTLDMLRKLDGLAGGENLEVVDILAEVMNLGGDWTGALELSRKVADADDAGLRLGALVRTARIENRRGKPGKAMEDIQLAEELASAHDGEVPLASILLTKGVILRGTGDYKGAMQALGRSIDVALEEGGKKETMQALMERGNIDILIGSFKSAEKDLKKALAAAEELNSQIDVARIMVNLSLLEMKRGELEGAYRGFNNALLIGREICQPRIIGYGLVGLAECSNMMSRPDDSLKFSNEAMPIFESLGAVDQLSAVHSNIGMSHALGGNGERAMENFEASIALVENLESPYTLGLRYMEYGKGQQVLGDVDGASKMLKKAQTIFVDIGAEEDVRLVTKMFQSLS
ncbi:MAG: hypothetical protein KAS67_04800, partial [Thermoplasmata archaeon]|nr:hypothetical protein [Thermoplasmata archaeon]